MHEMNKFKSTLFMVLLLVVTNVLGQTSLPQNINRSFPASFECKVQPYYKHRKDGKPGREITLIFKDSKLYGSATIKVECNSVTEESVVNNPQGADQLSVLLPDGAGVDKMCQARISILTSTKQLYQSVLVPAKRQWTVYIYPHSHVDIGYTGNQEFVRNLHIKNIDVALDLAKKNAKLSGRFPIYLEPRSKLGNRKLLKNRYP
jgi:alpha-mannosidase